jgi:Uma2 family endonuclease
VIYDGHIGGTPDLIVEILSPSTRRYDESVKLNAYANSGIPEYGVVDPRERQLRLYRLQSPGQYGSPIIYSEADTVTFNCLPSIPLNVGELFADTPDTII